MNTYTKFFLALCCSGTIVSCSNDLDEKVYSKITEQTYNYTVDDFSPSIASVYSQLRSFPSHGGYFTTQEVSADAIVMPRYSFASFLVISNPSWYSMTWHR